MAFKEKLHLFPFSKRFFLVLSLIFGLASASIGVMIWDTVKSALICGLIGFAITWLAYYAFIFFLLFDSTAKGEEL
jgi:hypothetical protein